MSWIKIVGIGPGSLDDMTRRAFNALKECDVVVGYKTYIKLINTIIQDKQIFDSGMRQEITRCQKALELAASGKNVCVISSGDPGIYGMAGLVLELSQRQGLNTDIQVIPGISAINSAASILGAPLMHDFAVISLSDHLTPWELIEKRLDMAAQADFVIALYNPKSRERRNHLNKAIEIILKHKAPDAPAGIVKNASREGQMVMITTLSEIPKQDVDMTSIIIIGNRHTFTSEGKMITPRGYDI
ncbi:MAG TPA: precorrin-3B C(17)-methyltransferase [Thermoanaerobacterales bacterium]|nr:precorrin-3B C(17)-methyltransferase [Thermoanaerobacterales bacterium]